MRFPVFSSCLQPPNWTNFRTKILVQKRFFSKWFFRHGLYAAKRCVFNGFKPLIRLEIRHGTLLVYKFFLQTVRKIVHERKKPLRAVCGPPGPSEAGRMPGYPAGRRSRCQRPGRTVGPPGPVAIGKSCPFSLFLGRGSCTFARGEKILHEWGHAVLRHSAETF